MLSRSTLTNPFPLDPFPLDPVPLSVVSRELEHALRSVFPGARAGGDVEAGLPVAETLRAEVLTPPVDIDESDDAYRVHVELPGVSPDKVEVTLEGAVLTVSGVREFYADREPTGFRRVERRFGRFTRAVRLPGRAARRGVSSSRRR
jgi:HSP20 family molecular chaperone IbpA